MLEPRALEVRRRRTVAAGGSVSEHATVYCPRDEESIPLSTCLLCDACEGLRMREKRTAVFCRHVRARPARSPSAPRRLTSRAERTPIRAVLTGQVVCVRPDLGIEALIALLADLGMSGAPVVNDAGRPVGVISRTDLLAAGGKGTVADHMMPIAFTLPESATVSHAASLMACEGVHRVPVVDASGSVIGIVSALDLVRWIAQEDADLEIDDGC